MYNFIIFHGVYFNLKEHSRIQNTSFYDINQKILFKKRLFPKIELILIFALQVMHDLVHWHCCLDYWVQLILIHENFMLKCSNIKRKQFLPNSFEEMYVLEKCYKKVQKILILKFLRLPSI